MHRKCTTGSISATVIGATSASVVALRRVLRGDEESAARGFEVADSPQRVGWVSGAALAAPRSVFDRLGFLDEGMFWAEDLDFCYRAAAAGIPVF
ncbi:MAG: hypothetical protein ABIV11_01380 [Gemmatimonadaceae bacterium]